MRKTICSACVIVFMSLFVLAGCSKTVGSTPKATAAAFARAVAAGDADGAKKASTGGDPAAIDALAAMAHKMKKLHDAIVTKFGEAQVKTIQGSTYNMSEVLDQMDAAQETITGDSATLIFNHAGHPMKLKKVDGNWKVDASEVARPGMVPMFEKMGEAASQTADEISAGKYATPKQAADAFTPRMMGSFLKARKP
ncbi:MAG TPA: hypothetical protein VFC78_04385 [Tepidisphaeraceae bacterium]|nr:hypothetical protein [Tepidisphaeraceae bacterium]